MDGDIWSRVGEFRGWVKLGTVKSQSYNLNSLDANNACLAMHSIAK